MAKDYEYVLEIQNAVDCVNLLYSMKITVTVNKTDIFKI